MRVLFCKILSLVSRVLRRGQNASLHDFMTFSFLLLDFFPTVFFDSDIFSAQWLFIWRHDLIDFLDGIFASRALSSSFIIASLPWTDWIRDSIDSLEIFTGFSPTADGPMPSDHWRFPQLVHRQTGEKEKTMSARFHLVAAGGRSRCHHFRYPWIGKLLIRISP